MKILYIHTYYRQRGGEDNVYETERKLMETGGCKTDAVLFNNRKFAAVKFIFVLFNPISFIQVYRKLGQFRPDIVHVHNWFFGASPSVFLAARMRKIPVVHTIHNFRILCPSAFLYDNRGPFLDSVKRLFPLKAIANRVYRDSYFFTFWLAVCTRLHYLFRTWQSIDRLVALTDNAKNILINSYLKIGPDKVMVKPNFFMIPSGEQRVTINASRSESLLFVGRLSEEKGIDQLLASFSNSIYSLVIIGDGPLRPVVEKYILHNSRVTYLGFQNNERVIEEMCKCSALIFPSVCYEQFGLTIIEAFSCGTPVIASDSGSPVELVCHGFNGLHFKTGSANDLEKTIDYWFRMPKERQRPFYQHALETYQQYYTADVNFEKLSFIYSSVQHEKK